jgi:glyoxylase-like metal-dependent hydrolase (beta-lactamase superfamily II)
MTLHKTGRLARNLIAIGTVRYPAYIATGRENVMMEAGISAMGPRYYEELKRVLGDPNKLDKLFLTHSHFDHIGTVPYLKRRIPNLKIGASALVKDVIGRPGAVKVIKRLSEEYERKFLGSPIGAESEFAPFDIDIEFTDGMEFDLGGGVVIKTIATPGHTRDSFCFYLPHARALVSGEAVGMPYSENYVSAEFLSSYEDYLASIARIAPLDIEMILLPHDRVLAGEEVEGYFEKSIETAKSYKDKLVEVTGQCGGDLEAAAERIASEPDFQDKISKQGKSAFMLNLKAQLKHISKMYR